LDDLALSSLVPQVVDMNRALGQSISVQHHRFVWVSFQQHNQALSVLHHRWTNHINRKTIDQIQKPLQRGRD